jgi:hypothetical protein
MLRIPHCLRQSAHRWRQGCQTYAPAAALLPKNIFLSFWYSFLLEAEYIRLIKYNKTITQQYIFRICESYTNPFNVKPLCHLTESCKLVLWPKLDSYWLRGNAGQSSVCSCSHDDNSSAQGRLGICTVSVLSRVTPQQKRDSATWLTCATLPLGYDVRQTLQPKESTKFLECFARPERGQHNNLTYCLIHWINLYKQI